MPGMPRANNIPYLLFASSIHKLNFLNTKPRYTLVTKEEKEKFTKSLKLFVSEENLKYIEEKMRTKERSRDSQGIININIVWLMSRHECINHMLDFVRTQKNEDFEKYLNHVLSNKNNDHLDEK